MSRLSHQLPIWVSRKTADGFVSQLSVPLWLFMLIGLTALINAVGWLFFGIYGLWHAWSGVL